MPAYGWPLSWVCLLLALEYLIDTGQPSILFGNVMRSAAITLASTWPNPLRLRFDGIVTTAPAETIIIVDFGPPQSIKRAGQSWEEGMKRTKAGPCSSSWQIHRTRAQRIILLALFGGAILATSPTKAEAEKSCENLKSFAFPNAKIIDASSKPGGSYRAPDAFGTPPVPPPPMPPLPYLSFSDLPPWCQVSAEIKPTPDFNINVQVWLPTERYNGDYLGTGNAGYGGNYIQSELAQGINNGFATANTDMGTSPTQFGVWADNLVGHPEKWRDFGWRSTHLMTEFSKALIQQFYGKPTNHSYFAGCSTGGQQALMGQSDSPMTMTASWRARRRSIALICLRSHSAI